jgi:hypothetical protein
MGARLTRFRAYLAIRKLTNDTRLRAALRSSYSEYAEKDSKAVPDSPNLTYSEQGLVCLPPALRLEARGEIQDVAQAEQELALADAALTQATLAHSVAKNQPAQPIERVREAEERLTQVQETFGEVMKVRETIEGQLELRQFVSKRFATAVSIVLAAADVLTLWSALNDSFDVLLQLSINPVTVKLNRPILFISNFIVSFIGAMIIIVCASIIGEIVAARKAHDFARRQAEGAVAGGGHAATRWERTRTWLLQFSQKPSTGLLLAALSLILGTSTIYVVIARYRFANADFANGYEGVIAVLAGLFFILPLAAVVAHVASSNQLKDVLREAVAQVDEAERQVAARRLEVESREQEAHARVAVTEAAMATATTTVRSSLSALQSALVRAYSIISDYLARHDDEVKAGFFLVRAFAPQYGLSTTGAAAPDPEWSRSAADQLLESLKKRQNAVATRLEHLA